MNRGARDAIVQTNVDLTSKLGGVVGGLDVYKSIDNLSVLVTPGTFYSSGEFSEQNNNGGGERSTVFTTQSFTGLPQTTPIANQPSYLLVYVKITSTSNNPDPTKLQTVATAKNIQTGENVTTRQYPAGTIIVSNPVLRSEVNKFNGVPLALLQVDYSGISKISSNGTIQSIDTSIRRDYTIGNAINVATKKLIADAIPDNFITTRMIGDGQVAGSKFLTGSITTIAIAPYDGSANITTTGNGIATDQLKNNAVTSEKMNYSGSLDGFSARNYLLNSSFENDAVSLSDWTYVGDTGTSATVETNAATTLFGVRSAKIQGGGSAGVPKNVQISQRVNFDGPINGQPISAFLYARPLSDFNLSEVGTNGINGVLEFFNNPADTTPVSGVTFASYSGVATGEFIKIETSAPIVIPKTFTAVSTINFSISGTFSNTLNVDGAFLGLTDISPAFNVAIGEQAGAGLNASNITEGELLGDRIANGAITTPKILNADGSLAPGGQGIVGTQIRDRTITSNNIANGTITAAELSAGIAAVPKGAILLFKKVDGTTLGTTGPDAANGCPNGFRLVTEMFGRFPLSIDPVSAGTNIPNPNIPHGTATLGNSTTGEVGVTANAGNHQHLPPGSNETYSGGGGGPSVGNYGWSSTNGDHNHKELIPYLTMLFCEKL